MLPSSAEAILVLYLLGLASGNAPPPTPAAKPAQTRLQIAALSPAQYAERTASHIRFEIEAARLAAARAVHEDVRRYARSIVDAYDAAPANADEPPSSLPRVAIVPSAGAAHEAWMKKLGDMREDAFDLAYLQMQINASRVALDMNRRVGQHGDGEALRAQARTASTQIERRMQEAERLLAALAAPTTQAAEGPGP